MGKLGSPKADTVCPWSLAVVVENPSEAAQIMGAVIPRWG